MTRIVPCATVYPLKLDRHDQLQVFLTRREFWDYKRNQPLPFPGEWAPPGGWHDGVKDHGMVETVRREFGEELGCGPYNLKKLRELRRFNQESNGYNYHGIVYNALIKDEKILRVPSGDDKEILKYGWSLPQEMIALLTSDKFTEQQLKDFERVGLTKHGITERQFPDQVIESLNLIIEREGELIQEYFR